MKKRWIKKIYWNISARFSAWKYPIDHSKIYIGVTGTDGKTTTSSFIYELAKASGYKPFLLTTVSARFEDRDVPTQLKSSSFFAYSIKNAAKALKKFQFSSALKNILLLDRKEYEALTEEHRTTPLASEIRKLICEYQEKGANFFILEVTSHALDQGRVYGITFDSIAYTNITQEHLDYHGNWKEYALTKAKLIRQLKPEGTVSLNKDDQKSYELLINTLNTLPHHVYEYSVKNKDKISLKKFLITINEDSLHSHVEASPLGRKNTLPKNTFESTISIFGDYNLSNALAAFSVMKSISSLSTKKLALALQNLKDINGRMNFLSKRPTIIVDFAHTPNAFEKALISVKDIVKKDGRLWVIFGCAGLRDHYKRPAMGKTAYEYADNILITSEDPRTESLFEINKDIISGFRKIDDPFTIHSYYPELKYDPETGEKFIVRFDEPNLNSRRNAIQFALSNAQKNDVVLMLGKGHETTMCFGTKEFPWNDIEETRNFLKSKKSKKKIIQ